MSAITKNKDTIISKIIFLVFLLSGACALVYEVVWLKTLNVVFGVTTLATATTLAAFMAGLGLGSYYLGRAASSVNRPLRLYGILELGIGIFAFLMPLVFMALNYFYDFVYQNVSTNYLLISSVRLVLSFVVLIPPTFLMGGTLPVVTRYLVSDNSQLGKRLGELYFINTLGAVVGTLSAGFFLMYYFGVREAAYLAGIINLAIGIMFLKLDRKWDSTIDTPKVTKIKESQGSNVESLSRIILITICISGFCSLAYQVLWSRALVYILDNTTHAFTTMLTAFLIGLALGSILVTRWLDRTNRGVLILGLIEIGIAASALVSIPIFMNLGATLGGTTSGELVFPTDNQYVWASIRFARSMIVMVVPTILMGMTIPIATRLYSSLAGVVADSVGRVYSANTLGSVFGAFCAGLVLIPAFGVYGSIVLAATINVVLGVVLLLSSEIPKNKGITIALFMGVPVLCLAAWLSKERIVLSSLVERQLPNKILFYKEGVAATVKVYEESESRAEGIKNTKTISINGFPVAGTIASHVDGQKTLGNLPFLLSSVDSPRVNIIGFGAGGSAWASTLYQTSAVDLVELVPDVISGARHIPEVNHGAMDNPKVNIIYDDGRNYLNRTRNTYDIISVDATSPKSAGSGSLYSLEFYKSAAQRLSDDGIMIQWMPYHLMTEADVKMIGRTFKSVFPEATLWFSFTRHYYVMIGTKKELKVNFERLQKLASDSKVQGELNEVDASDAYDVLATFLMSSDGLAQYVGEGPLNTDNNPLLEYDPTTIYLDSDKPVIANLNSTRTLREKPFRFLDVPADSAEAIRLALEERIAATPIESYWPQYMR
jgi:spermidine synthase